MMEPISEARRVEPGDHVYDTKRFVIYIHKRGFYFCYICFVVDA